MPRSLLPVVTLALVGSSLTGCGLLGGSDSLDDALEVVPASMSQVRFFDRDAATERLGIEELDADPSDDELTEYLEASRELPAYTALDQYLVPMIQDAPFSAQDIDWEVAGYEDSGDFGQVWRMDDDLDLDDVVDDLVDLGFEKDDVDDGTRLTIELSEVDDGQTYLVTLQSITVLPDDHLIVSGPLADDFVEVVADDADSAVDKDTFEDLVDGTDDAELAVLSRDDLACRSTRMSPEQQEALDPLGRPDQTGFLVHGDEGEVRSVLLFDDDEAAENDAEAREDYLAEGTNPISGEPFEDFADWEIAPDGRRVHVDLEFDEPRIVQALVGRGDHASFAVCGP